MCNGQHQHGIQDNLNQLKARQDTAKRKKEQEKEEAKQLAEKLKKITLSIQVKEMGKIDVGQSVVIKDKMIMAVEAIEGTDMCIKRGSKLAKKNAVIVKVAKPSQDKRFDIPAIGLRTLKTMKRYKADLIAVEANETIIVDQEKVIQFADENNIVIMAV